MAIPEDQLNTWSHTGAGVGSAATYQTVRNALLNQNAPYANQAVHVFLQGSYGNGTNVYAESDVDVVIRLDSAFSYNIDALPQVAQQHYQQANPAPVYGIAQFRPHVIQWLQNQFPGDVTVRNRAIQISARGNRRSADVLISQCHRDVRLAGFMNQTTEGVRFLTRDGQCIINYPILHSDNLTVRHQLTNGWLKPVVRIFKNMRNRMADDGRIERAVAPSYYIEGILYNVPTNLFRQNYATTVLNCLRWVWNAQAATLMCAHEQCPLIGDNSPIAWPGANCRAFILAAATFWDDWRT